MAHIFPAQGGTTFTAEYVPNSVISRGHCTVTGLALDDVDAEIKPLAWNLFELGVRSHSIEKVGSTMLPVKGL
jgi:hypothetical protein